MASSRVLATSLLRNLPPLKATRRSLSSLSSRHRIRLTREPCALISMLNFSDYAITPNLRLHTSLPVTFHAKKFGHLPKLDGQNKQRPLLVLLEYMNAKEKHVHKFVQFYINYGFDVLRINLKPWQLLWPVKGSQMVANDVANFLYINELFSPMLLHGFSVGGYLWGEVLVKFSQDLVKYQSVTGRICGQIFDSGVDVNDIPTGFPSAVFPNNPVLKSAFEKYIRYHMKTFYNESTKHYVASRIAFTKGIVKAPTLLIFSDADSLSTPRVNEIVQRELSEINVECYVKSFQGSKHVMHFHKYKEEYLSEVETFLAKIDVLRPQKLKAKL